jgi:hypothetical protein
MAILDELEITNHFGVAKRRQVVAWGEPTTRSDRWREPQVANRMRPTPAVDFGGFAAEIDGGGNAGAFRIPEVSSDSPRLIGLHPRLQPAVASRFRSVVQRHVDTKKKPFPGVIPGTAQVSYQLLFIQISGFLAILGS